jgi:hypothetical protein
VWICGLNGRQSDGEIENAGKNSRVVEILTPGTNKGLPRTEELHHYRLYGDKRLVETTSPVIRMRWFGSANKKKIGPPIKVNSLRCS